MEFFCVLSVSGSLTSYHVQKVDDGAFRALLRYTNGKQDDIPAEISLQKVGDHWLATPQHEDVVQSLVHAIESNGR